MSLLHQITCNCNQICLCPIAICITKNVDAKIKFVCEKDLDGCQLDLETITNATLLITCPCCDFIIATINDFDITKCNCYIVLTPLNTNTLPEGEYNYSITIDLSTGNTLLVQQGKIRITSL